MTELRELRAVIPPPRSGRTKVSASVTKEAAATYFAIDAEAGTITWHKRHFKPVSYRLPGHTQPAALPVLCKVLTVFLVLYEPSVGSATPIMYFVFVGEDGRCLLRRALGLENLGGLMWPDERMSQLTGVALRRARHTLQAFTN